MVEVGFAVTLVPVVALSPVEGDQVYVDAPLAVKVVDAPLHIVASATLTVGNGLTVTIAVVVFVHPDALVPVIV